MQNFNNLMTRHNNNLINMENSKTEIVSAFKTQKNWKPVHTPGKDEALKRLLSGGGETNISLKNATLGSPRSQGSNNMEHQSYGTVPPTP